MNCWIQNRRGLQLSPRLFKNTLIVREGTQQKGKNLNYQIKYLNAMRHGIYSLIRGKKSAVLWNSSGEGH